MGLGADLSGLVAVVTGASTGIGAASAVRLAELGCALVLVARRAELLHERAAALGEGHPGCEVRTVALDVLDPDAASTVVEFVRTEFGTAHVLVNSAGGSRPIPLSAPPSAWTDGMELNFFSLLRITHALLPAMLEQGFGRVVHITGGSEPRGLNAASPAKAATHAWSKGLSCVVAARGVTMNCVAPGRVHSEQISRMHPTADAEAEFVRENIPAGYLGSSDDVARLVAFLAAPASGYITGEVFSVDGGMRRYAF